MEEPITIKIEKRVRLILNRRKLDWNEHLSTNKKFENIGEVIEKILELTENIKKVEK